MVRKQGAWREVAFLHLDKVERGVAKLGTKDKFARSLGIARQTLWRDEEVAGRFEEVRRATGAIKQQAARRATPEMRARSLEAEVRQLTRDNAMLIQNFVAVCRRLREEGLDPYKYMGEIAENAEIGKRKAVLEDDGP